jgi:hypothetical protein
VPGHTPHPFAQPGGYAYGQRPAAPPWRERDAWRDNAPYLRGCDFFNRGWWWEAHEAWESLWHVVEGRDAAQHALLKALIQLAAAALNRERGHDRGAEELLAAALGGLQRAALEAGGAQLMGLDPTRWPTTPSATSRAPSRPCMISCREIPAERRRRLPESADRH